MSRTLFGLPIGSVVQAVKLAVRAHAVRRLRSREHPTWKDPLGDACPRRGFGQCAESAATLVLVVSQRTDLLRNLLGTFARRSRPPRLLVVAADPGHRGAFLAVADGLFGLFGVPFEIWFPDAPPSVSQLVDFAHLQQLGRPVILAPAEAYLPDDEDWDVSLLQAMSSRADAVCWSKGNPELSPVERIPVLGWSGERPQAPYRVATRTKFEGLLPFWRNGGDYSWAPLGLQRVPALTVKDWKGRLQGWLYRHREKAFIAAGAMLALVGYPRHPAFVELTCCFLLPDGSLFLVGWISDPLNRITGLLLESPASRGVMDLRASCSRLPVPVVDKYYRQVHLPEPLRGFVVRIPPEHSAQNSITDHIAVIEKQEHVSRRLAIPVEPLQPGLESIRTLASTLAIDHLHAAEIIERHLAPAISALEDGRPTAAAIAAAPAATYRHIYGEPPRKPEVSIVVPIYGRWDFMRYQMATYSEDRSLDGVEWIYVIDDPALGQTAIDGAQSLHEIFGVPFKLLCCGANLGFSGATNLGVHLAAAPEVLLLNSDVFPVEQGWLQRMRDRLTVAVGMVGAQLLYEDLAVQHAGMEFEDYSAWSGMRICIHPGKGLPTVERPEVEEAVAVTAACVLVRRDQYLAMGGLSESFVVGDFEDGDLCARYRRNGLRIVMANDARLYHLERQSIRSIGDSSWKEWVTLFNCWLFNKRAFTMAAGSAAPSTKTTGNSEALA